MSVIYKIIYPNGKIYVGTAAYGRNAYLVEFDPATEKLRIVLDVHKLVGLPLTATGYAAQSKLHTRNFVGPSGKIYVGSKQGYPTAAEYAALRRGETIPTYRGGYVIVYDPATDTAENLGMPMPIERKPAGATEGEGVIDVTADEARGLIYVITCEQQHWMLYDLKTKQALAGLVNRLFRSRIRKSMQKAFQYVITEDLIYYRKLSNDYLKDYIYDKQVKVNGELTSLDLKSVEVKPDYLQMYFELVGGLKLQLVGAGR